MANSLMTVNTARRSEFILKRVLAEGLCARFPPGFLVSGGRWGYAPLAAEGGVSEPRHILCRVEDQRTAMKARTQMATKSSTISRARRTITVKPTRPAASPRKMRQVRAGAAEVPASLGRAVSAVRDGMVNSLTALTKVEGEIVVLVRSAVSSSLGAAGNVADELVVVVRDVVSGAVQATEQVGAGLIASAKSIAKGVVLGVHEVGGDVATAAAETVRTVIRHAGAVSADVGSVARRAVDGVVEAAAETGERAGRVAKAAVDGAIKAAGEVGANTARTVADVLAGVVRGVKDVAGAASPRAPVAHKIAVRKRAAAVAQRAHRH